MKDRNRLFFSPNRDEENRRQIISIAVSMCQVSQQRLMMISEKNCGNVSTRLRSSELFTHDDSVSCLILTFRIMVMNDSYLPLPLPSLSHRVAIQTENARQPPDSTNLSSQCA